MSGEFLDTNVLVYAHDTSAGEKRRQALELVKRLAAGQDGLLSVQVLMEFYVTVTRKLGSPLSTDHAADIVADLSTWATFAPVASDILDAIRIGRRYEISFWDALIVHAASSLDASVIWSEDLNAGQHYEGVPVRNPFHV